jgi:hypothetical protein
MDIRYNTTPKKPCFGKAIADEIIGLTHEINPIGGSMSIVSIIGNRYNLLFSDGLHIIIHIELTISAELNQIITAR